MKKGTPLFSTALTVAIGTASSLLAQDAVELSPFTVLGSKEAIFEIPGSSYLLTTDEIQTQNYTNINRVLGRVPGVYVREEDGSGNFPNISIRGGDGTRSSKVTIMEDGVLTVPAPYSAPSAYYSPKIGRMAGLEILKGSSQIEYGPNTTGGVLNYVSTPVPVAQTFYTRNSYGSDNTIVSHSYFGDTVEGDNGSFGYLLELFHNESDGFRHIEPGTGYEGSDETGYSVTEPMVKLFWEPNSDNRQRLEFKFGLTDFEADESYTGLSETDVVSNPDARYAATRFDNIDTEHKRSYLKYFIEPGDGLSFEFMAYFNQFERDWFKLDDVDETTAGDFSSVKEALTEPEGLALLRGVGPGRLTVRHNAREYEVYGLQATGRYDFNAGEANHFIDFGIRFHSDYVERDQFDELFTQDDTGAIAGESFRLNNVRRQETDAISLWVKDEIQFGNLSIIPGIRYESIDAAFDDYSEDKSVVTSLADLAVNRAAVSISESNSDTYEEIVPGVAFTYNFDESNTFFGGIHKGISLPGPRAATRVNISNRTEVEESLGLELGWRNRSGPVSSEFVWFQTDFDSVIGTEAGFGNESSSSSNAGEVSSWGLETFIAYDALHQDDQASLPLYFSGTWTNAEFDEGVISGGEDGIFDGGAPGNDLPYVPELQLAAGIAYKTDLWSVSADATYTDSSFASGDNGLLDPVAEHNARLGTIDSLFTVDLSAKYFVGENWSIIAGVSNLFDERAIVSRVPRGPRANKGRSAFIGFEFDL